MTSDAPNDRDRWSPTPPADGLTLRLWRPAAERLATAGLSRNALLAATLFAGTIAFLLFWSGHFGLALVGAVAFLVVGLASEARGGTAWALAVLPLFWWWGWWHGLFAAGHPLAPVYGLMVLWATVAAGAADLALTKRFEYRFGGTRITGWRSFDSRFALVAAGPSVNLAILALGLVLGCPGSGLAVVAWWSIVTIIVHAVRLNQAADLHARGKPVIAWRRP